MDISMSDDLWSHTLDAVLEAARQICRHDVDPSLDPIAAGFDSIATMELSARLEEELGVDCTLEDVFEATSLAELAGVLARRVDAAGGR